MRKKLVEEEEKLTSFAPCPAKMFPTHGGERACKAFRHAFGVPGEDTVGIWSDEEVSGME